MEREQEMLNQLTQYMEKYQNLTIQDINKMTLKEVNGLIDEISKLRESASELYDQMRDFEELGEYLKDILLSYVEVRAVELAQEMNVKTNYKVRVKMMRD